MGAFGAKAFLLVCFVLMVAVAVFVWRVSQEPLDISFAKDYIRAALHDEETGNSVRMERVVLYWPDLKGALYLQLHGGQLVNRDGVTIISIDTAAISFSRSGLLAGRILPKSIVLKQPTVQLVRTNTGEIKLDLGYKKNVQNVDLEEQFALTTRVFGYIARPGRESANRSVISRLEAFSIENARLFVDDQIASQSWSLPDFNAGFYSIRTGMKGYAQIRLPDVGLDTSELRVDMDYLWDQKDVVLSADLKNIDVKAIAGKVPAFGVFGDQDIVLNAHIETILGEDFLPEDVRVDVRSKTGHITHPDLSDDSIPYSNLSFQASYNYAGKALLLKDAQVTVKDVTFFAGAGISHTDDTISGPVKVWIDDVRQEQIGSLWPKVLRGDNSEKWIVKKMSAGIFRDVTLDFDFWAKKVSSEDNINAEQSWDIDIQNLVSTFAFEDMSLDYRAPLDVAKNINGSGRFDLNKDILSIDIKDANLGVMPVSGASLLFDEVVAKGKGGADIQIQLNGKVRDVMQYLSTEPINLGDDINMDINKVKGQAALDISLKFPTQADVKLKDFEIAVDGTLTDVLFPDVVETLDLSGGPLDLSVKDGLVRMTGKAMLEKRPMDFAWETFLNSKGKAYKEKVSAKITADPNIRKKLGIDLDDFIEGSLPVNVDYISYRDGRAKADVKIDATPALFFVTPFDFQKQPGQKAGAQLVGHFKDGKIQNITDLTAEGKGFKLSKSNVLFKHQGGDVSLSRGSISHFSLGETKAKLDFVFQDDGAVHILMDADVLDAQSFLDPDDDVSAYEEPPMKISVSAKQMRTAPKEIAKNTTLFFDIDDQGRFNQMEMDATIGKDKLYVRFKPDKKGVRTFRLKAGDAGAFLKAFGLYDNIRGGTMVVYGVPVDGVRDRNLRGKAEVSAFKVVKAPFLSKILSILSLTGIADVFANDGLAFDKLESDFNWLYRRAGSVLVLKEGRTSGNSLGLLFDGTFDNHKRNVDVSGTIVPMSGLNKVIGSIPLVGNILTGGSGGVFAATYRIHGSFDDPEIFVNPLSILTPGIIRRILFE